MIHTNHVTEINRVVYTTYVVVTVQTLSQKGVVSIKENRRDFGSLQDVRTSRKLLSVARGGPEWLSMSKKKKNDMS